jgi:L-lysine epsilon oxidase-like protein
MANITSIKIHPAIGIARLGNSSTEYFIGPEKPGYAKVPKGGYKDAHGNIKRQAARFRLFGYDARGRLVKEITKKDASIVWSVHLANKKAAWNQFDGLNPNAPLRNASVTDRNSLIIDPGSRSLNGPNQAAQFDTGRFLGTTVPLGEMRTDSQGRLLVLGGFGQSASPVNAPLTTYANNDGWHDDVSDGPVSARIKLKGSNQTIQAVGAWVICSVPKFAPRIHSITTLYDVLLQVAVDKLMLQPPKKPSFTHDIYPILQRAINMKWVSGMVTNADAHTTLGAVIPPPGSPSARTAIFERLRNPSDGSGGDMPMVHSDNYPAPDNQPLTKIQYSVMQKWKEGNFINDWSRSSVVSKHITPEGLDRAGLESCVGGPFYPGIEAGWLLRDTYTYSEPFRLDATNLKPGDVTKQMAVPWQADFNDCEQDGELAWWPAQRPDDVFPDIGGPQVPWTRNIVHRMSGMVKKWYRLGFIIKKGSRYIETEREP